MSVTMDGEFYKWYDHGEGSGGDEIKALMLMRGIGKEEAIAVYHEIAGVQQSEHSGTIKGKLGKPVAFYDYLDAQGRLVHQTVRFEPKAFLQRRPAVEGSRQGNRQARQDRKSKKWWLWTLDGVEPVLYHLPELLGRPGEVIWLVEGEKDADELAQQSVLTTTAPMGAKKWRASYTDTLRGRTIVLCGDSDTAGQEHMIAVGDALESAGCKIEVIDWMAVVPPERREEKWDAAKWLNCELAVDRPRRDRFHAMVAALVPWAQWRRPRQDSTPIVVISADTRPELPAPKDGEDPREFAIALGKILGASGRFFIRADQVMTLHESGLKLTTIDATEFVFSMLDHVALTTFTKIAQSDGGGTQKVLTKLNKETANQVLFSPQFRRQLPEVDRVLPVPVPVWGKNKQSIVKLAKGYNPEYKVLVTGDVSVPQIDYETACRELNDRWLGSWPYCKDDVDRSLSTVIAAMLAPFCDLLIPPMCPRPAFVFTANKEGSGKTVLATLSLAPTYGSIAATMVPEEITDAELEKRLLAIALSGKPYMLLDNWKGKLQSAALEGFLTKMQVEGRLLGESTMAAVDKCTLVFVTANTVEVSPDMRRRSLFVELFVEEVQPETRQFDHWIDDLEIMEGRERLLGCLWAIVEEWNKRGMPAGTVRHGTFRQWGDVIGALAELVTGTSPLAPPKLSVPADRDLGPFQRMLEEAMEGRVIAKCTFQAGDLMEIARNLGEWDFLDEDKPQDGTRELRAERKIFGNIIKRFVGCSFPNGYKIEHTTHVGRSHRRVIVHRPVPKDVDMAPSAPSAP